MLNLNDREWRPFFLRDICDIESGCDIYDAERVLGNTPYITSSALNNGIRYFVGNNNGTLEANCISVNRNGSVGYSFYHKYLALYSNDCRKLRLKKYNNEYVALFITNQIMQQKDKYNYSIKMGTARLKKQKVMLPVDEHDNPDYTFMEHYIKERERQLIQKYKKFIGKNIQSGGALTDLKSVKWKKFIIGEIFDCFVPGKSKGLNHLTKDMILGKSYVGATNRNNGVLSFVQEDAKLMQKGNAIGFIKNGNGSAGYAIYKQESFISTSDVIFAYANWLNKYNGLFITTCSDMSEEKYSHGYKWTKERLVKSGIMLPVNEKGSPDYEFMEQHGKRLMLQKYQQYLNYISART